MAFALGTKEASVQLITDLYIALRKSVNKWAAITKQTPQARMGYVGQHLVSVVTGFPGGRTGARGDDLVLGNGEYAEIKTCYRVDQLGKCNACGEAISSIEDACPVCGSEDVARNDDSKWLISIRNDAEFEKILDAKTYYLVLFDFVDLAHPDTIRASIWQVDPRVPGFALCMVDYYLNIRARSTSKAPFNLWPYSLKFDLMRPELIYQSFITGDGVETVRFPGENKPELVPLRPLAEYSSARNLSMEKVLTFAALCGYKPKQVDGASKVSLLREIDREIDAAVRTNLAPGDLADNLAWALYHEHVGRHLENLPKKLKDVFKAIAREIPPG